MLYSAFLVICCLLTTQWTVPRAAGFVVESYKEYASEDLLFSTEPSVLTNDTTLDGNSTQLDFEIEALPAVDDDIIELNVGGVRITTLRSTLTAVPNSTLALMFAKNNTSTRRAKDALGAVFFDYNPLQFEYLLDQLRAIKRKPMMRPYEINIDAPTIDTHSDFSHMIDDLGLTPERFLSPLVGAHVNLLTDSLIGWQECYRSTYDAPFDVIELILKCLSPRILFACRPVNSTDTLTLAGVGKWQNMLQECSQNTHCTTKIQNGTGFYFVDQQAWGFEGRPKDVVPSNNLYGIRQQSDLHTSVHLNPCDSSDQYSEYRLCWSLRSNTNRGGGDRCGAMKNLHNAANWERVVYRAS